MVNECCSMVVVIRARKAKPARPHVGLAQFIARGSTSTSRRMVKGETVNLSQLAMQR